MPRFATTVDFYERFRPVYPSAFFANVAVQMDMSAPRSLLDLGTGPGLLALGFAPYVGAITAVDPEPAMLELARQAARRAGREVSLIGGRTEDLAPALGPFDFITIGRALHWMDPEPTKAVLERLLAPGGAILVCAASPAKNGENAWLEAYDNARRRWSREVIDRSRMALPSFFAGSRFTVKEKITVLASNEVTVEHLAQRVLSYSSSSPAVLGERIDAMLADVRETLAPFAEKGKLTETVESWASVVR